jgi:hypothetical protein
VDSLGLTIALGCLLALPACGSGNLGKTVAMAAVAKPEARGASAASDAGARTTLDASQTSSGIHQGTCGDSVLQTTRGEQCDGNDFGGQTCVSLGLGMGLLTCDRSTCRVITSQCRRDAGSDPGVAGQSSHAKPAGSAGAGGGGSIGRGGTSGGAGAAGGMAGAGACPLGFDCLAPPVGGSQSVCVALGELEAPLCITAGSTVECSPILPGSTCTDTGLGLYCVLPCSS